MPGPLIAIVGSSDPKRQEALSLRNTDIAKQAGEDLGKELAKKGCRILVYASYEHLLEVDVVRGFVSAQPTEQHLIQVRYSQKYGRPNFAEEKHNRDLFFFIPDNRPDWEISFYRSLSEIDGIIVLGGGTSTLVAGLVAMGHRKPILACAGFGAAASKVWDVLSVQQYPLSPEEMYFMADERWTPELAQRLAETLFEQRLRFAREDEKRLRAEDEYRRANLQAEEERLRAEYQKSTNVTLHAIMSALLFIVSIAPWPIAWGYPGIGYIWLLCLLLLSPLLAGASGATVRVVIDWIQGTNQSATQSVIRNAALGIVAGGIAGVLFILAQLMSNPSDIEPDVQRQQADRLVPFSMAIGFIAGLTLEAVFRKLRNMDVVRIEGVQNKG